MQVVEVDNFLDSLKSPRTKEVYAINRKRFLDFIGRKSVIDQQQSNLTVAEATQEIIQYLKKLKDDGLSYSYRMVALAAIKHDYIMNDTLVLNWEKIAKFLGENERKYEIRGYTHDEIRRMVDVADIKYKAVILMLASTGMRRDALVNIELRDLEYLKDYNLYKIKIYKKSDSEQICYTTPEAAEAIKLYVSKRPGAKYFHNVQSKAISLALMKLAIKAGIVETGRGHHRDNRHRNEIPATHGLRKFCITQMAKAKVDTEVAKILTGHSIGVRGRYLNYTEDDLLQEYLKAVDLLTINEENRLRIKVNELTNVKTQSENAKISALENRVNELTEMIHLFLKNTDYDSMAARTGYQIDLNSHILKHLGDKGAARVAHKRGDEATEVILEELEKDPDFVRKVQKSAVEELRKDPDFIRKVQQELVKAAKKRGH